MTILIDMDDTIEHLLTAWLSWLNDSYGTSVECEDVKDWNMQKAFPMLDRETVYAPLDLDEFWETVKPIEGAAEAIRRFMDRGHEIYIVTATPLKSVTAKVERVLFRYFPFIKWEQVIITANKQLLKGDILIDDGYHNMVGGSYHKILIDAPYNRMFDEKKDGVIRVHDWAEIEREVEKIEAGTA